MTISNQLVTGCFEETEPENIMTNFIKKVTVHFSKKVIMQTDVIYDLICNSLRPI